MIPYQIDQDHKAAQLDAAADHLQHRWELGYDDAIRGTWKGCQHKTADCSRYCSYLHGYEWGIQEKVKHYNYECISNPATLDTEYYEF